MQSNIKVYEAIQFNQTFLPTEITLPWMTLNMKNKSYAGWDVKQLMWFPITIACHLPNCRRHDNILIMVDYKVTAVISYCISMVCFCFLCSFPSPHSPLPPSLIYLIQSPRSGEHFYFWLWILSWRASINSLSEETSHMNSEFSPVSLDSGTLRALG